MMKLRTPVTNTKLKIPWEVSMLYTSIFPISPSLSPSRPSYSLLPSCPLSPSLPPSVPPSVPPSLPPSLLPPPLFPPSSPSPPFLSPSLPPSISHSQFQFTFLLPRSSYLDDEHSAVSLRYSSHRQIEQFPIVRRAPLQPVVQAIPSVA